LKVITIPHVWLRTKNLLDHVAAFCHPMG
jgi:hypothetical protein